MRSGRGLNATSRSLALEPAQRKADGPKALLLWFAVCPCDGRGPRHSWGQYRLCTLAELGVQAGERLLRREGRYGGLRQDKVTQTPALRSAHPSPRLPVVPLRLHAGGAPSCFWSTDPSLCVVFHFAFSSAVLPRWNLCSPLTLSLRPRTASSET